MTVLYNCHTDGDEYRITKFNDGEVESSYLCSTTECQCPAGSRQTCRHRQMLPMFLNRGAVDTFWFLDFERKAWVDNEPAELLETRLASKLALDQCERSELSFLNDEPALENSEFRDHPELAEELYKYRKDMDALIEPASLLPISDYALSRQELEELSTYHDEVELLPTKPSWRRL